jgi:hypothetical protein
MKEQHTNTFLVELIEKQSIRHLPIAVDIVLFNGNIELKAFRVYEFDEKNSKIKGMTLHEEYAYQKEDREPNMAIFHVNEIKSIQNSSASYSYLNDFDQIELIKFNIR